MKRALLAGAAGLALSFAAVAPARADPITAFIALNTGASFATASAITTFVVNAALSFAVNAGLQALSARNQRQNRQASVLDVTLGEGPREAIFGRVVTGGQLVDCGNYGGEFGTDSEVLVIALADHLCDALEGYYVDDKYYAFTGNGKQTGFWSGSEAWLEIWWRNGAETQYPPALAEYNALRRPTVSPLPNFPIGTPMLAGVSFVWVRYQDDAKVWSRGRPRFRWKVRGLRLYDARKDSTAGGSGSHRWNDVTTHEWSRCAYLARYHWARGIYACGRQDQTQHLLIGRGLSLSEAPTDRVFSRANICDEAVALKAGGTEPRYCVDAVVRADETFDETEQMFADAMGGVISQHEGAVEIDPGVAKSSVLTFTDGELITGTRATFERFLPDPERINSIIPRYISPEQGYVDHAAPTRRSTTDMTTDGGLREDTLSLPMVTSGTQAQRCAEIKRRLGRLERRARVTLGPRFSRLEEGDWVTWTSNRYHGGGSVTYLVEAWALDEGWNITLQLREVAASAYSWTAATDEATPNTAPLAEPAAPAALTLSSVAAVAHSLPGPGGTVTPAVRFTWATPVDPAVLAIRAEIRIAGEAEAAYTMIEQADAIQAGEAVITNGVAGGASLEGRLGPIGNQHRTTTPSAWIPVTAPTMVAAGSAVADSVPWTGVTNPTGTRPANNATVGATVGTGGNLVHQPPVGSPVVLAPEDVITNEGTSNDTDHVAGVPAVDFAQTVADLVDIYGDTASAAQSALDAALAAATARKTASLQLPMNFEEEGRHWANAATAAGAPASLSAADLPATYGSATITYPLVAGAKVLQAANSFALRPKGYLPVVAGRTYRSTYRALGTVNSTVGNNQSLGFWEAYSSAGALLGSFGLTTATHTVAAGLVTTVDEITAATILAAYPTAAYLQPWRSLNQSAGGNGTSRLYSWLIEDVTSEASSAAFALVAQGHATTAGGHASAASGSAVAAGLSESSAASSAVLSASVGSASINDNPVFALFPTTPAFPTGWAADTLGAAPTRVAGNISPYAARLVGAAGSFSYMGQSEASSPGLALGALRQNMLVVLEAEITLVSGSLETAGVLFYYGNSDYATKTSLIFSTDKDITETVVGAGTVGKTYRFSKIIRLETAPTAGALVYACSHHSGLGGSMAAANSIDWHKCLARPADAADINGRATAATVSTHAGAISTLEGKNKAYLQQEVNAGAGAVAFMSLRGETSIGSGVTTSDAALGARTVSVWNPTGSGSWIQAMKVEGGDAIFSGNLRAGKKIKQAAGPGWEVAFESKAFVVTDGQFTDLSTYGFDANPLVYYEAPGASVPGLSTGQVFNFYASGVTPGGFYNRLRKTTPGGSSSYTSTGVSSPGGGGPLYQMDKSNAVDAANGYYNFRCTGSVTTVKGQDGIPAIFPFPSQPWTYGAMITARTWFYTGSGSWVEGDPIFLFYYDETPYESGDPGPTTYSFTNQDFPSYFGGALGQHGGKEFGLSDVSGADSFTWVNVNWVGNASTGDATATPGGETARVIVVPRNAPL